MWKTAGHERGQKKKSSSPSYDLPITGEGGIYPLSYGESHGSESKVIDILIVQHHYIVLSGRIQYKLR